MIFPKRCDLLDRQSSILIEGRHLPVIQLERKMPLGNRKTAETSVTFMLNNANEISLPLIENTLDTLQSTLFVHSEMQKKRKITQVTPIVV